MAEELHDAMKCWGTDEQVLIDIICSKSFEEIQEIAAEYEELAGKTLIDHIKSEVGGDFEDILVGLCTPRPVYDANLLHKSMDGMGTNETLLSEVLAYRSTEELIAAEAAYDEIHADEEDLKTKIEGDTSGNLQKLCLTCFDEVDEKEDLDDDEKIEEDCEDLNKAGEKKWGTDEGVFIRLLGGCSREYREKLYWKYPDVSKNGYSLTKAIKSEFSGTIEKLLCALVEPTEIHYAEALNKAMVGMGTDEAVLIRVLVTQKERSLQKIGEYYLKTYERSLKSHIESEVSGNFKKALISVLDNWCKLGEDE